ncbi:hypothetical protein XELAEV_18019946mg [Xenopus laevis]|uniref:C3H1-type domain-containing protein n=1 Tax=Xenopus laevis TaxID=8355 RepID=A0A974HQ62_XENLA|nr:hypothetical protein XELAEV_18019946mg [Xenopus laevis]
MEVEGKRGMGWGEETRGGRILKRKKVKCRQTYLWFSEEQRKAKEIKQEEEDDTSVVPRETMREGNRAAGELVAGSPIWQGKESGGGSQGRGGRGSIQATTAINEWDIEWRGKMEEASNEGEWSTEAAPIPAAHKQLNVNTRGGGSFRLRGNGHPSYEQYTAAPSYTGQEYEDYLEEENVFEEDNDDVVEDYDYDYDFAHSQRPWQNARRPRWTGQQDNMYVPSFYFRNSEEEESWRQWRRERKQQQTRNGSQRVGQQEQASTSAATQPVWEEAHNSAATIGKVSPQEAAFGEFKSQGNVLAHSDSESDMSDSETEEGNILALIKKYFQGKKEKERGDRAATNTKEGGQSVLPLGAADTYACALTATAAHLPRKLRKTIEAGKFVDIYGITREAIQAKEDGVKNDKEGKRNKSIFDWLKGFLVFASIYLEKKPEQCLNVIKYMDTIVDTYLFYKGTSWSDYDRAFRKKIVNSNALSFGQKDIGLWRRWVLKEQGSFNGGSGTLAYKPRNVCFAYNEKRCNRGYACKFRHVCSACGLSHVVTECSKRKEVQANRQPF